MDVFPIRAKLSEDIERFDPAANARSRLAPFRDLIVLQRAKGMSYDQIASMFIHRGVSTSVAAVGRFCRVHITQPQLARARAELRLAKRTPVITAASTGTPAALPKPGFEQVGPKIARDDF